MLDLLAQIKRSPAGDEGISSEFAGGETLFHALFNAAPDPVLLFIYRDGEPPRIVEANQRASIRYGVPHSELVGMTPFDLEPAATDAALLHRRSELRDYGQVRFATVHRARSGEEFPVEVAVSSFTIDHARYGVAWVRDARNDVEGRERGVLETQAATLLARQAPGKAWPDLLDLLLSHFHSPNGLIAIVEGDGLRPVASRLASGEDIAELRQCCGACNDAVDRKLVIIREKFAFDADAVLGAPVLAAPVVFDGQAIGLLALSGRQTPYLHSDADRLDELASILAPIFHGQREAMAERALREEAESDLMRTAERLEEAQRLAKVGSWELDIASGKLIWSREVYRIFEIANPDGEASYTDFIERVHPDDRAAVQTAYSDAVADHRPYEISHRVLTTDGRVKHVQERGQTIYSHEGKALRTIGTVQDVTEQFYANEQLRLAASMFEASADGILVADASNRIMTVNRALERMMGYSADELVGQTPRMLRSGRHDKAFYSEMWSTIASTGRWSGEVWDRRKSGEEFPLHLTITAVRDSRGITTHYGAVMRDITSQRRTEERIFQLAFHDQLTGLPNRGLFRDRIDLALNQARRAGRSLAVLFLDLDRFKNVNDSFGHDVGDALLVEFARRIRHAIRVSDTVSRQGGDEFVVLLPNIEHEIDAARAAENVIHAVSEPFEANGREITITSSIGIAVYPSNGADADTLLRNADAAMYAAKASGRNCFRFFTDDLNRRAVERLSLENDLRRAIERHELVLYFQPQIDLVSGQMIGAEALVRWSHPTRGLLGPDRFIPIAEETRLIVELDAWVMRESCTTIRRWRDASVPMFTLAVNASAEQLRHNAFRDLIAACLRDYSIDPVDIELEFTETILIEDQDVVLARLADIRSLGVSIAIDDFGTGYSSLSYLPRFAARRIKLASSFVRGIEKNPQTLAVAASMIDLAHRLGMTVVAEGVESRGELKVLKELGCDAAQGFFLARPMPEDELLEFAHAMR